MDMFNQSKGISPLIKDNRFAKELMPILKLLLFRVLKWVCLPVKMWLKLSIENSTKLSYQK